LFITAPVHFAGAGFLPGLRPWHAGIFRPPGGKPGFDGFKGVLLLGFVGQHIVRPGLMEEFRDLGGARHGVDGDDGPFELQAGEEPGQTGRSPVLARRV